MLCVIAKLDETATNRLIELQKAAFPAGAETRTLHGHITLATYIGEDEACFVQSCKRALAGASAFIVVYEKIEVLDETSILVATPEKSEPLAFLHRRITERFEDTLDRWTKGDRWYPHTTLAVGPQPDLQTICDKMRDSFSTFEAWISKIEFSRVYANAFEIVDDLDLASHAFDT